MSQLEVNEFIVVAPATLGKAVEWAEPRLLEFLGDQFPSYRFRIEPFGPFADDEEFSNSDHEPAACARRRSGP